MPRAQVRRMVEAAVALALTVVLHNYVFYALPNGGRITAASMVSLFVIALRWGPAWGMFTGAVAGLLLYLVEPFFVHPIQWLLDYPIAFGAIGVAGLLRRSPALGVLVGGAARLLAHYLSGVVFFASSAPRGQSPWLYSALYNGSFMLPEIIISIVVTMLVLRSLQRLVPAAS